MPASKCRPFMLHHCWKILEFSEKWRLRDHEAPPKKGSLINMEDDVEDEGGRNKNKPDGRKMEKDQCRRSAEASSLKDQIASLLKAKEAMMSKHLEVKLALAEEERRKREEMGDKMHL